MIFTEAYKEHIEYTFNAFCRVVVRYDAINTWRDRDKRKDPLNISQKKSFTSSAHQINILHTPTSNIWLSYVIKVPMPVQSADPSGQPHQKYNPYHKTILVLGNSNIVITFLCLWMVRMYIAKMV